MIKIPEELCKECGKCCHGTPGEYVFARTYENKFPQISKEGRCQFLNNKNKCKLGCKKPIECILYPIRIFADGVFVDKICPGWEIAVKQWKITHGYPMKDHKKIKEFKYERII